MNNKMIFACKNCHDLYCGECSDNKDWMNYCSEGCEKEAEKEKEEEKNHENRKE